LIEGNRVGRVTTVIRKLTLQLLNYTLVQIDENQAVWLATEDGHPIPVKDHAVYTAPRFVVGHRVCTTKTNLRQGKWILGEYNPDLIASGVVVEIRTEGIMVEILAFNPPNSQGLFARYPPELVDLAETPVVVLSSLSDGTHYQIGDRVSFIDRDVETGTYGIQRMDRRDLGGYDGNVYMIVGTKTLVDVDWQDMTTSKDLEAKDLRIYLNVDEYEGWPVGPSYISSNHRANMFHKRELLETTVSESFNPFYQKNGWPESVFSMKASYYPKSRKSVYTI
jgi:hypothetical protein